LRLIVVPLLGQLRKRLVKLLIRSRESLPRADFASWRWKRFLLLLIDLQRIHCRPIINNQKPISNSNA